MQYNLQLTSYQQMLFMLSHTVHTVNSLVVHRPQLYHDLFVLMGTPDAHITLRQFYVRDTHHSKHHLLTQVIYNILYYTICGPLGTDRIITNLCSIDLSFTVSYLCWWRLCTNKLPINVTGHTLQQTSPVDLVHGWHVIYVYKSISKSPRNHQFLHSTIQFANNGPPDPDRISSNVTVGSLQITGDGIGSTVC